MHPLATGCRLTPFEPARTVWNSDIARWSAWEGTLTRCIPRLRGNAEQHRKSLLLLGTPTLPTTFPVLNVTDASPRKVGGPGICRTRTRLHLCPRPTSRRHVKSPRAICFSSVPRWRICARNSPCPPKTMPMHGFQRRSGLSSSQRYECYPRWVITCRRGSTGHSPKTKATHLPSSVAARQEGEAAPVPVHLSRSVRLRIRQVMNAPAPKARHRVKERCVSQRTSRRKRATGSMRM